MFIGSNIIGSCGPGSCIYQPVIGGGGLVCNFSLYDSDDGDYKKEFDGYTPVTGYITDDNDSIIGYRDPITGYFSGVPTEVPVTPALSGDYDRPIGFDDNASRVEFNINESPTVMHLPAWYMSFYTATDTSNARVYAEGINTDGILQYTIQSQSNFLNVVIRNTAGSYLISVTTTEVVFDGANKFIEIEKFANGDLTITVDGVPETFSTGVTATLEEANTSTIGAIVRTTVSNSTFGSVWDLNKNGQIIPLNEGTGTDIKDSTGTSVGTLVDPNENFWNYSVSTWTLVEDKYCPPSVRGLDFTHPDNSQYILPIVGGGNT